MAWRVDPLGKQRARNAMRRKAGLCLNCPMPSPRYRRCLLCRVEFRERYAWKEREWKRSHRAQINARARKKYAEMMGRPIRVYRHKSWRKRQLQHAA